MSQTPPFTWAENARSDTPPVQHADLFFTKALSQKETAWSVAEVLALYNHDLTDFLFYYHYFFSFLFFLKLLSF